ncbi:MAG: transporter substrate-binding domain-containing protein [Xanthomonadales bacterium]|nr:transporter substrate-binding domain-containing protein [Xanthomonadales bacterium]
MRSAIVSLIAMWMAALPAWAQQPLQVAVRVAPPFVIEQDGHYEGLLIDLFEEIAAEREWQYAYHQVGLKDLLQGVEQGRFDLGLGAISASAEREAVLDFSHPVSSTGLAVATRQESRAGWQAVLSALISPPFLRIAGGLFLLLLLLGSLVWLAERRRNPEQFGGSASDGIASGFWWAAVTMTTVGYGDKAPVTLIGRLLALIWMIAALVVVSTFTAAITSALTVGQLSNRIQSADDLNGKRLLSVADSTSAQWLTEHHLSADFFPDVEQALAQLAKGKADAVIHDEPLLRWTIERQFAGKLVTLPLILERQDYAIALPPGSPLREELNRGILERVGSLNWSN